MYWFALCVICMNIVILQAKHDLSIKKLIEIIRRRNSMNSNPILGAPQYPEHLPEAEPILPGHSLIRPARGMLKSAVKYPLRDTGGSLVYGNVDNIGIADDKNQRVLYSNFRKAGLLASLKSVIRSFLKKRGRSQRRYYKHQSGPILGAPRYPEHLPEAEPILPGHSLIRPARGMLKSAVKYPLRDTGDSLVYGNTDNIGIANNKNERVLYTDFRKSNVLSAIAHSIREFNKQHTRPEVYIPEAGIMFPIKKTAFDAVVTHTDEENDARETLDEFDPERVFFDLDDKEIDFRRKRKSKSKFRYRSVEVSDSETDASSASSEYERNPGNPYSIHKNKYKQNWLWNHFMDGNHMNINPYGPPFKTEGPAGTDLMFGRKWWYFNQDDYKPMR